MPFRLLLTYFLLQLTLSFVASHFDISTWLIHARFLDSAWYEHIAQNGYTPNPTNIKVPADAVFAFLPEWPAFLHFFSIVARGIPLAALGCALSFILLSVTLYLVSPPNQKLRQEALAPQTQFGLFLFLFSPGAWVFFTNHTEALFLFLSFAALYTAVNKQGVRGVFMASLLAGLAALTRNQGVVLAIATALALTTSKRGTKNKIVTFLTSGTISALVYALWIFLQWYKTGDPMVSSHVQNYWHFSHGIADYISNMFWISRSHVSRRLLFFCVLLAGILLLRNGKKIAGTYVLLSALLWPLQGNSYPQAFRFSSVIFPFWFWLGDLSSNVTQSISRPMLRWGLRAAVVVIVIACTSRLSWAYWNQLQFQWPY